MEGVIPMTTYNLDVFISGKNHRVLQITGNMSDKITGIQVLRSFSPINSQDLDDTKLYGEDPVPVFRVYIDDPYSQDNRLGGDYDDWEILGYLDEGKCVYIDDERLPWNKSRDVYYKMRVFSGEVYTDTPIVPAGRYIHKEGASTISQQLIKNTHLSNEKTISRKLKEIALTRKLEKQYSKDEILESYLNVIYFGNGTFI